MPEIFSKDCKVTVIEYGGHYDPKKSWQQFQQDVLSFFRTLFRFI